MDTEDSVERAWLFGVSDFKREGQEFDFGFWDLFRGSGGGAVDTDVDLFAEGQASGLLQFKEDSSADILDEAFALDGFTFIREVGAPLVVRVRRKERVIGGEDAKYFITNYFIGRQ